MNSQSLPSPQFDPTPIFEIFRGGYGADLLTAAVAHFDVFTRLLEQPLTLEQLGSALELQPRAVLVMTTALRAMQFLERDSQGRMQPTPVAAEHLVPCGPFDVTDYLGLAAGSPGVLELVERLRSNTPAGGGEEGQGTAFIYRAGVRSAMAQQQLARHFTLSLAGRAKNVAPCLADRIPLDGARCLLDVAGGTGIYSIALLKRHPHLRAKVLDLPEVLKIAAEFACQHGVEDRLELVEGDMFGEAAWPAADLILLSNVLHDWDAPACRELVTRAADTLPAGGRLCVHDVFLNDELDGPLPIALYSIALFTLTEGRAYSAAEYRQWLAEAGLQPSDPVETLVHCGVLTGRK